MSSLYYYGYYDKIRKQIDYELQKLWSSATLNYCDFMCINTGFCVRELQCSVASVTSLPLHPPNKAIRTIHQNKARRIAIKKLFSDQKSVS